MEEQVVLSRILDKISKAREAIGKKDNTYLVVNIDEPYAYKVAELMEQYGHHVMRP